MLKVPLESQKSRRNSISSIGDDSFDPRRLTTIIDDQNRLIRKLKLRISKLENTLEKKKEENKSAKGSALPLSPSDLQFSLLKAEMERSNLLEDTIDKISYSVKSLLTFLSEQTSSKTNKDLPTATSCKSLPGKEQNYLKDVFVDEPLQNTLQKLISNIIQLQSKVKNQRVQCFSLEQQNKTIKKQLKILNQQCNVDSQELKQLQLQYENERKKCLKLKSLLQKSQYERNNMYTQMHKMAAKEKKKGKSYEDLVCLSESLNVRIKDLEFEKEKVVADSLRQQEKWQQKFRDFHLKLKASKKKNV